MNRRAMIKPLAIAAFALTLAACSPQGQQQTPPATIGASLEGSSIGGAFTLNDKDGKRVSWDQFKGKYRIVYFGYTFCPDACPMDMAAAMKGFARFEKASPALAAQVQPLFISIDPARDTPKAVGEFSAAFHPRLIGLTGSAAQVDRAAKAFAAYYARGKDTAGGYLMDHSRVAYLMGRKGEPIAMLPVDKGAAAVEAELAKWVR